MPSNLNIGLIAAAIAVVAVGILVNAQLIDSTWANRAVDLLLGGGAGYAVRAATNTKVAPTPPAAVIELADPVVVRKP